MKHKSKKPINSATPEAAFPVPSTVNSTYEAVYIYEGVMRKVWFEATSLEEARAWAAKNGFALQGQRAAPRISQGAEPEPPGAFNEVNARRYLGGMSRTALYRLVIRGALKRTKKTRRLLITRKSLDAYLNDVK